MRRNSFHGWTTDGQIARRWRRPAYSGNIAGADIQADHAGLFSVVAQGDYVRGKPNPDPFLKAAERLGVEPARCLALEDSHNGVRAASGAGMMTIMVPDLLASTPEMERLWPGHQSPRRK
jgi:beta-phosphoglucomutase-like phosphatase (HAD superfamily)